MEKERPRVFYRENCSQCRRILSYLDDRNIACERIAVQDGGETEAELQKLTGQTATPAIIFRRDILRRPDIPKLNALLDKYQLDSRPGDR